MIKRLMLSMLSYPEITPDWAIVACEELAVHVDAELNAIISVMHIPDISNVLARKLVGADSAIAAENRASRTNANLLASRFSTITGSADKARQFRADCLRFADPDQLACHARLFDLSIVPLYGHPDTRWIAEGMLFLSGRPLLLLPERSRQSWTSIVIAWDGSRAAARALADSLPICQKARDIRLLTITGDKPFSDDLSPEAAAEHLAHHGVSCTIARVEAGGRNAGSVLLEQATLVEADLVVMGGFGHARMREFILGGATDTILQDADLPVLLSH
jgi:nucleotide-binding universal stress UspA family protein